MHVVDSLLLDVWSRLTQVRGLSVINPRQIRARCHLTPRVSHSSALTSLMPGLGLTTALASFIAVYPYCPFDYYQKLRSSERLCCRRRRSLSTACPYPGGVYPASDGATSTQRALPPAPIPHGLEL